MVLLNSKSEIITILQISNKENPTCRDETLNANNSRTTSPIVLEIKWLDSVGSGLSEKLKFKDIGSVEAELFKKL